jgi:hypothetical protein
MMFLAMINLSPRILKELADEISPLLQLIYTKSLDTGEVPADWRTANVSPVYKKGLKSAAENYICCDIKWFHCLMFNARVHSFRFYKLFFREFRIC